jgi:hypothetical protein
MPFDPSAKIFAVRLTVGDEVTWYGGDEALMDYATAFAQYGELAQAHIPSPTRVNTEVAIMRRTPKRWVKSVSGEVVYRKRRPRLSLAAQHPAA